MNFKKKYAYSAYESHVFPENGVSSRLSDYITVFSFGPLKTNSETICECDNEHGSVSREPCDYCIDFEW